MAGPAGRPGQPGVHGFFHLGTVLHGCASHLVITASGIHSRRAPTGEAGPLATEACQWNSPSRRYCATPRAIVNRLNRAQSGAGIFGSASVSIRLPMARWLHSSAEAWRRAAGALKAAVRAMNIRVDDEARPREAAARRVKGGDLSNLRRAAGRGDGICAICNKVDGGCRCCTPSNPAWWCLRRERYRHGRLASPMAGGARSSSPPAPRTQCNQLFHRDI